jgi:hypothetical protein
LLSDISWHMNCQTHLEECFAISKDFNFNQCFEEQQCYWHVAWLAFVKPILSRYLFWSLKWQWPWSCFFYIACQ